MRPSTQKTPKCRIVFGKQICYHKIRTFVTQIAKIPSLPLGVSPELCAVLAGFAFWTSSLLFAGSQWRTHAIKLRESAPALPRAVRLILEGHSRSRVEFRRQSRSFYPFRQSGLRNSQIRRIIEETWTVVPMPAVCDFRPITQAWRHVVMTCCHLNSETWGKVSSTRTCWTFWSDLLSVAWNSS